MAEIDRSGMREKQYAPPPDIGSARGQEIRKVKKWQATPKAARLDSDFNRRHILLQLTKSCGGIEQWIAEIFWPEASDGRW
jgi:hypothetical protein